MINYGEEAMIETRWEQVPRHGVYGIEECHALKRGMLILALVEYSCGSWELISGYWQISKCPLKATTAEEAKSEALWCVEEKFRAGLEDVAATRKELGR